MRHGIHSHGIGTFLRGENKQIGFLADRSKPHRLNPEMGMGKYRYYICPTGLIKPEELPEKWGLIYVSEKDMQSNCRRFICTKIKYFCQWSKKNKSHFDHQIIEENFKT